MLRGKGVPRVNSSGAGNFYVHFKVVVPTKLSERQARALRGRASRLATR